MNQIADSFDATFSNFIGFLPTLAAAIVVLIAGWIVAWLLGSLTDSVLERLGFDNLVQRGKVKETFRDHGSHYDPSRIVGAIVFWAALITTFLLTADILGLTAISTLLTGLVAFLPFVAVAVIALVVAVALAQIAYDAIIALIGDRVEGAVAIASAAKWGIIAFGIFVALSHLRIAPVVVNGVFLVFISAIGLAFAISFGWGNIELAREITGNWYHRTMRQPESSSSSRDEQEKGDRPAA